VLAVERRVSDQAMARGGAPYLTTRVLPAGFLAYDLHQQVVLHSQLGTRVRDLRTRLRGLEAAAETFVQQRQPWRLLLQPGGWCLVRLSRVWEWQLKREGEDVLREGEECAAVGRSLDIVERR
jgi:hypothetical protein